MLRCLVTRVLGAALLLLPMGLMAAGPAQPALDETLPNGMRVLVYENHRAPTALHMVWVKAGSIDETSGRTGLAHVLEHMMFKGTKNLAPGEFSRRVAALGGRENAFTSKDYTGYFQQVHKDSLKEVMRLEADRQRFLVLDEAEFKKEIQVVMEERRLRTEDSPEALAHESLLAQAFVAHPVRNPIIGWMNDLENLTIADVQNWYRDWYVPNNLVLVVAGDVNAKEVFAWAKEFYGPMKSRPLPARKPQLEPDQNGQRRVALRAPAKNAFVMMAYKSPSMREDLGPMSTSHQPARDLVALQVLSSLLDDPGTGRLSKRLVRDERVAISVSADAEGVSRSPGLFVVDVTASPGVSLASLQEKVKQEIARVAVEGVDEKELTRVKRQAKAGQVFKQDSTFSLAMEAARLLLAGRPLADADNWLAVLDDIKSEDLQRVARSFFADHQMTVLEFEPLPLAQAAPRKPSAASGLRH